MARNANPADMMRLSLAWWTMMAEAQTVIGLRTLGMAGILPAKDSENSRMVSEKVAAMTQSLNAAGKAALAGKRPDEVALAAIRPLGRKTRANAKRLSRRTAS